MGDTIADAFAWLVLGMMVVGLVGLMLPILAFLLGFLGVVVLLGAVGWVLGRILS